MKLSKDDLSKKYNSMKNEDLAEELGVSLPTLMKIIDSSGIERKGSGNPWNRKKIEIVG